MDETFELGFSIDTTALTRAATEANRAAQATTNLGNAERQQATAANQSTDATRRAGVAMGEAGRQAGQFEGELKQFLGTLRVNQQEMQNLAAVLQGQSGLVGGLNASFGAVTRFAGALGPVGIAVGVTAIGLGILAKQFYDLQITLGQAQDRFLQLQGRLTNSLGSVTAARDAIDALRESTQKTGLGFTAASDAFARIARNNDSIGLTQREMLQLVETTQKLGRVSGASAGEMQAGMIQFGQALASGKLQGDELRSIMENFPALAKAIADNFEASDGKIGVSIGTLRRLGSEGELTGSKIAEAVLRATEDANAEYAKIPDTIEQANQRVADSWDALLVTLGEKFQSSQFVQSIANWTNSLLGSVNNFIEGPSDQEQLAALRKELEASRQYTASARESYAANLMIGIGTGGYAPATFPGLNTVTRSVADIEAEIADVTKRLEQAALEAARAASQERTASLVASSKSASAIAAQYESAADKQRRIQNDIDTIDKGIADAWAAVMRGGTEDDTPEDLRATIEDLQKRRVTAEQSLSKARESDRSVLANLLRDASDANRAREQGGAGGGEAIVLKAIQQLRQDAAKGQDGALNDYINAGLNDALRRGQNTLDEMARSAANVRKEISLVGAERSKIIDAQIEQEAAAEQARLAGTLSSEALVDYMTKYRDALRESKLAADALAAANRVLGAQEKADLAQRLAIGAQDPTSQARIREDFDLERARREMGPGEQYDNYAGAVRDASAASREQRFAQQRREMDLQREQMQAQAGLARLGSEEYRVQSVLLQKRLEFLREGLDLEDARVMALMRQTEELERAKIASDRATVGTRNIMRSIERGADELEGTFKDAFQTVFTDGLSKAADIFEKGFGDIIKRIAADMIYELGFRAMNEIALQIAESFGQWISGFIPGAAPAAGGGARHSGSNPRPGKNALGNIYDSVGLQRFASGGAFTNRIVDQPTYFAFAAGVGLMGEAGPEAIMPLKRASDGRLGVSANGGGDVQVIVNDMRSSEGAAPVETKTGRGPDGRRMISVMIRDEMRRQIRSGDLDRDMSAVYGNQRQLSRK